MNVTAELEADVVIPIPKDYPGMNLSFLAPAPAGANPLSGQPSEPAAGGKATRHPIDTSELEYSQIPGLVGGFFRLSEKLADRSLPKAALAGGLHAVAMACGVGRRMGIDGRKIPLTTFTIAESAGGKNCPQELLKELAREAGSGHNVLAKPRSDKDMILNLLDMDANHTALYVMDEAHGLLNAANDNRSGQYTLAIADLMLELATTKSFVLSGNLRREVMKDLVAREATAEKRLATLEGGATQANEGAEKKRQEDISSLKAYLVSTRTAMETVKQGIENPVSNYMMSSTPGKMAGHINAGNAESGLLGRSILFDCGEVVAPLNDSPQAGTPATLAESREMVNAIRALLADDSGRGLTIDRDAQDALQSVKVWADHNNNRNHPVMGAILRRHYERVANLASLIAWGTSDALVTLEVVRHAVRIDRESMAAILNHLSPVNLDSDRPKLIERILSALKAAGAKGVPRSALKQRATKERRMAAFSKTYPKVFEGVINELSTAGKIRLVGATAYFLTE